MSLFNDKDVMRQIIISHYDKPNNKIENTDSYLSKGYTSFHNKSSSCIDDLTVLIKMDDSNLITDAKFFGIGCAISSASTDIMCDMFKGLSINESLQIISQYEKMIKNEEVDEDVLQELIAFKEIYKQPGRIKCSLIGSDAFINIFRQGKNE
ncbi:MAG: Fe-S cluster assembly sulfur transfer protein SufU [Mycoplasma sp.]